MIRSLQEFDKDFNALLFSPKLAKCPTYIMNLDSVTLITCGPLGSRKTKMTLYQIFVKPETDNRALGLFERRISGVAQIKRSGGEDRILNYINYECMMRQVWANVLKLTD
jgi:hypothetical protein